MPVKNHFQKEKPWAILGWTRKYWKAQKMWKKARVTEEKMAEFLRALDHETVQNIKDNAHAEVLVESMFGVGEE